VRAGGGGRAEGCGEESSARHARVQSTSTRGTRKVYSGAAARDQQHQHQQQEQQQAQQLNHQSSSSQYSPQPQLPQRAPHLYPSAPPPEPQPQLHPYPPGALQAQAPQYQMPFSTQPTQPPAPPFFNPYAPENAYNNNSSSNIQSHHLLQQQQQPQHYAPQPQPPPFYYHHNPPPPPSPFQPPPPYQQHPQQQQQQQPPPLPSTAAAAANREVARAERGVERDKRDAARRAFRRFDVDRSGFLDVGEFTSALTMLGVTIDFHDAMAIFALVDDDHNGSISEHEFVSHFLANY